MAELAIPTSSSGPRRLKSVPWWNERDTDRKKSFENSLTKKKFLKSRLLK